MSPEPVLFIKLPIPPSVNHCYRTFTTKKGRRMRVLTGEAKKWMGDAANLIKDARNRARWIALDEKTVMAYWVWWPDLRDHDCDNILKLIQDALKEYGIVTDDHLILPRAQDYDLDRKNPRVEVMVWRLGGAPTIGAVQMNAIAAS